ncbi:hypothetical protein [Mycolicibacterium mageritense]|uniref:Uncharacterized protein n=1 Tax=Mycolicibacterium mageritense TaxID=53462 RepID=A0AAI8XSI8_MYCME|nr:hypothetical protein [Mycolicibacterium mageritense]BDY33162.1 hypothetical protein hbim_07137 [Mycolicibacterium mageritense]
MTNPEPADGKFVNSAAVVARLEGKTPSTGRVTTIKWRILDVENELMGEVPSLRTIDLDSPDPAVQIRIGRVRTLVIDKVLELYRNPDGASSKSQAMDGISTTRSYRDGSGPGISFTEDELNRVRLPKPRRPKLGTYGARPWMVP